jgi:pyruvate/2-oxoglutarate dehydrogenase complex dihydrolipoamide dehydrogenase (E3) component
MSQSFDAIIIGAGQAGPSLAGRLTAAGMRVALIERDRVGGTCVNTGCTPTKTLIASAHVAHLARRAGDYGVATGPVTVDMTRVKARADAVAARSRIGLERWLGGMERLTLVRGHARFEEPHTVRVGDDLLSAPLVFINVGGRPRVPDLPGVTDVPFLTSTSILALATVPRHLVVVGGSYIGLEFAQAFRRFGAEVTVVETAPRLIAREDEDVSEAVRGILEAEGVTVRTAATCISLAPHAEGVAVGVECASGEPVAVGSHVLLAVGRQPNTDDLGLHRAGIATDERGFIVVDETLRTSADGVYALGDCNGRGAFTHTAYNDGEIVAANLLDGARRRVSDRLPGYALYIDPPLGRVGLTEAEAWRTGRPLETATRPMTAVGRAIEKGETEGFMKVIADADTKEILGAAILGVGGDEAIHALLNPMKAGVTVSTLEWAVPIHPTVAELIPTLLRSLAPVAADRRGEQPRDLPSTGETAR